MIQNEARDVLNTLLVDLFNDILKIEASVLKEGVAAAEAEELKAKLEEAGATVTLK